MIKHTPKKSLGQNFLIDKQIIEDLIEAAEIRSEDTVLEIGAGMGAVTGRLARIAKKVITVEIDRNLIPILKENLNKFGNIEIVNRDILKLNLPETDSDYKLVGSIPYQITSPLIHKLIFEKPRAKLVVILIQKEVAQKIVAEPPRATYLSNFIKTTYKPALIKTVKADAFKPKPKVDGAIVRLERYKETKNLKDFSKFLHKGFSHPRKMLNKVFDGNLLKNAGVDYKKRPQELNFNEWLRLHSDFTQTVCH